jgi:hypothetical protein
MATHGPQTSLLIKQNQTRPTANVTTSALLEHHALVQERWYRYATKSIIQFFREHLHSTQYISAV